MADMTKQETIEVVARWFMAMVKLDKISMEEATQDIFYIRSRMDQITNRTVAYTPESMENLLSLVPAEGINITKCEPIGMDITQAIHESVGGMTNVSPDIVGKQVPIATIEVGDPGIPDKDGLN